MTTSKEKALELYSKFNAVEGICSYMAKEAALICIQEVLNEFPQGHQGNFEAIRKAWWEDVKIEVEELQAYR